MSNSPQNTSPISSLLSCRQSIRATKTNIKLVSARNNVRNVINQRQKNKHVAAKINDVAFNMFRTLIGNKKNFKAEDLTQLVNLMNEHCEIKNWSLQMIGLGEHAITTEFEGLTPCLVFKVMMNGNITPDRFSMTTKIDNQKFVVKGRTYLVNNNH